MPRENRVEKSRMHFSCQAQYLVKLECDFSWQAQHFVQFWEIAGARNVVFLNTKGVSKMGRVRSPKRRVRDDDFMVGLSSDYPRVILGLSSNRLYIGGSNSESFQCNLELKDFVAGAVFAEVGGWLCLLCALEMTFHMRRASIMRFILRGRRSIWWSWIVTFRGRRSIWWHFGR